MRLPYYREKNNIKPVIYESVRTRARTRNQSVHEYLTYGMPLIVDGPRGRDSRTVRFFDFDQAEGGLNEFVVTTQFRVRRGNERGGADDDERMVIPDLVLFVNGVPLVVMEAKSPSLLDVWRSQAVRQLRRYQEAGPEWHGSGAPELFHYNLLCVAHCGAAAAYATLGAPENAYFEWKSVLPYTEDEVQQRFRVEPQGQAQLIVGLLSPATLLDILRDYVVYEPERGQLVKKLPRYQQYRAVRAALDRLLSGRKPEERGGVVWHTQGSGKSLTMLWLATKLRREPRLSNPTIVVATDRMAREYAAGNSRRAVPKALPRWIRGKKTNYRVRKSNSRIRAKVLMQRTLRVWHTSGTCLLALVWLGFEPSLLTTTRLTGSASA